MTHPHTERQSSHEPLPMGRPERNLTPEQRAREIIEGAPGAVLAIDDSEYSIIMSIHDADPRYNGMEKFDLHDPVRKEAAVARLAEYIAKSRAMKQ